MGNREIRTTVRSGTHPALALATSPRPLGTIQAPMLPRRRPLIRHHNSSKRVPFRKRPHLKMRPFPLTDFRTKPLHAERGSAAAGALHVWIFKLETCAFERLAVLHDAPIQIHPGSATHNQLTPVTEK